MAPHNHDEATSRTRAGRAMLWLCGILCLSVGSLGLGACRTSGNATITPGGTPVPTAMPTLIIVTPTPPAPGQPSQSGSVPATPAAANPTPAQSSNSANGSYTVQSGDTLYTIAVKFNVTIKALMAANSISDPSTLQAGQVIVIP